MQIYSIQHAVLIDLYTSLLNDVRCFGWNRDIETALDDLSEVCRRNRHSEETAVRSLLPPELYQASMQH